MEPKNYAFASDTCAPVHPKVLEAIQQANKVQPSYGGDDYSTRVRAMVKELLHREVSVLFVTSGTAANMLCMANLLQRDEAVMIASSGHMLVDECMTLELLGHRLIGIPTVDGKLTPELLEQYKGDESLLNRPRIGVVSISQSTEWGTVYTNDELRAVSRWCVKNKKKLHIDGARIANAVVANNGTIEVLLKNVFFDALSFGCTKNGGSGDIVVLNNATHDAVNRAQRLQLQLGQLPAKTWQITAGLEALFTNNLWLKNAEKANEMGALLEDILKDRFKARFLHQPREANALFMKRYTGILELLKTTYEIYAWDHDTYRIMTSWNTTPEEIHTLVKKIEELINQK